MRHHQLALALRRQRSTSTRFRLVLTRYQKIRHPEFQTSLEAADIDPRAEECLAGLDQKL
jgi:hypothetical protein